MNRPDRDRYVTIRRDNILEEKLDNFDKKTAAEIDSFEEKYDYGSIMHYRKVYRSVLIAYFHSEQLLVKGTYNQKYYFHEPNALLVVQNVFSK